MNKEISENKARKGVSFGPDPAQKKYWVLIWLIVILPLAGVGVVITIISVLAGLIFLIPSMAVMFFTLYWYPLYHQSLYYTVTDEHVVIKKGVWWQKKTTVPLQMITNVDRTQNPLERIYGIGKIHMQTAGAGGSQGAKAEAVMTGVKNLSEVQDDVEHRMREKIVIKKEPSEGRKEDIFERILAEIKAIRQKLKK